MNIPFLSNEQFEVFLEEGNNAAGFRDWTPTINRGLLGRISQLGENRFVVTSYKLADAELAKQLEGQIDGAALAVAMSNARNTQRTKEEKLWIEAQGYEYSDND